MATWIIALIGTTLFAFAMIAWAEYERTRGEK